MFSYKVETLVNAPLEKVWDALTKPELVKQYMFGTDMSVTAWEVGGSISYKGQWEGKAYEDKGKILAFEPQKLLKASYWSSMGGKEDKPENYEITTYSLSEENGQTKLSIIHETPEKGNESTNNWQMVLDGLKKVVEKK